jgi:hypothetical protein
MTGVGAARSRLLPAIDFLFPHCWFEPFDFQKSSSNRVGTWNSGHTQLTDTTENTLKPAASSNLWRPLRLPTFRNLLIADVVSDIGTFMQSVGAAWLMVALGAGPIYVARQRELSEIYHHAVSQRVVLFTPFLDGTPSLSISCQDNDS